MRVLWRAGECAAVSSQEPTVRHPTSATQPALQFSPEPHLAACSLSVCLCPGQTLASPGVGAAGFESPFALPCVTQARDVEGAERVHARIPSLPAPLYMAPELLRGEPASKPADVWALGAVMWEMVSPSFEPPFNAQGLPALVRAVVLKPLPTLKAHEHALQAADGSTARLPDETFALLRRMLEGLLTKAPHERMTLDSALAGALCREQVAQCKPSRLKKSLASETRLHEILDDWASHNKGGRSRASVAFKPAVVPKGIKRWRITRLKATAFTSVSPARRSVHGSAPAAVALAAGAADPLGVATVGASVQDALGLEDVEMSVAMRAEASGGSAVSHWTERISESEEELAEEEEQAQEEQAQEERAEGEQEAAARTTKAAAAANTLTNRSSQAPALSSPAQQPPPLLALPTAGINALQLALQWQRNGGRDGTARGDTGNGEGGVSCATAGDEDPRQSVTSIDSPEGTSGSRGSTSVVRSSLRGRSVGKRRTLKQERVQERVQERMQEREAAALSKARRASLLFDSGTLQITLQAASRSSKRVLQTSVYSSRQLASDMANRAPVALGSTLGSTLGSLSNGLQRIAAPLLLSSGSGSEPRNELVSTYACCDGKGHPGQIWVSSSHVCFVAARGARVVINLVRIDGIALPSPRLPWRKEKRAVHLMLSSSGGPPQRGAKRGFRDRESFYAFTNREAVARDVLHACAALGRTVLVAR